MNKIRPYLFILLLSYTGYTCSAQRFTTNHKSIRMGSNFDVIAVSEDSALTIEAIHHAYEEIKRVEHLISSWDSTSQTSRINQQAGIKPVQVDKELFELIKRSIKVSKLTDGAFDITYASLDPIWNFKDTNLVLPTKEQISQSVAHIGYRKIILNHDSMSIYLPEKGMKIGFGAIGKGYAANQAKHVMMDLGITDGLVNAGGDLIAWGKKADGTSWKVGIADPKKKNAIFSYLSISNGAVVTSGDYERFVMIGGKRYAHILDPRTGYPVTGLMSVTIMCPDAELADALATSVFVLGKEKGLRLINQLNEVECLLVTDKQEVLTSENVNLNE